MSEQKSHWEIVYATKKPNEVSWTQEVPQTSLDFIHSFNLSKTAKIIDIGGGDSNLVDFLLNDGFENITVLDISENALKRAKERLGEKADKINWVVQTLPNLSLMTLMMYGMIGQLFTFSQLQSKSQYIFQ